MPNLSNPNSRRSPEHHARNLSRTSATVRDADDLKLDPSWLKEPGPEDVFLPLPDLPLAMRDLKISKIQFQQVHFQGQRFLHIGVQCALQFFQEADVFKQRLGCNA